MESSAVLTNVGIILAKDLLADERINTNTMQHFLYDFEETDSDEAENFFQQMQAKKSNKNNSYSDHKRGRQAENAQMPSDINLCDYLGDVKDFRRNLHMRKKTFLHIFNKISDLLGKNRSIAFRKSGTASPMTCFSLAIWKLCTDEHFEQIAKRFHVAAMAHDGPSKKPKLQEKNLKLFDVHNTIREFWQIISEHSKIFIDFPFRAEQMQEHMEICQFNGLPPGMCGIIALKRFDVFLESSNQEVQIICQIIVNTNQKILDWFVEFANDYAFESTPIYRMLEAKGGLKPSNCYLIGDNNFTPRTYLITPFLKPESSAEHAFNGILKSILVTSIWDKMCYRFNALYALEAKDLFEVRRIISTICILHNMCVDADDNFVGEEHQIETCTTSDELNLTDLAPPNQTALERRISLMKEIVSI